MKQTKRMLTDAPFCAPAEKRYKELEKDALANLNKIKKHLAAYNKKHPRKDWGNVGDIGRIYSALEELTITL